jgi:hypothetical protein
LERKSTYGIELKSNTVIRYNGCLTIQEVEYYRLFRVIKGFKVLNQNYRPPVEDIPGETQNPKFDSMPFYSAYYFYFFPAVIETLGWSISLAENG